jgi:hypothetical protein
MSHGELGLVAFIVFAIVSARYWPRAGEWVVKRLAGGDSDAER